MVKPFDPSKFRTAITKSIDGIGYGFSNPTDWISTGNYLLNYRISGDFFKGIPIGKVTVVAGEPGAGKSYISSANCVKEALAKGYTVILIDSENAIDADWVAKLGVDPDNPNLIKLNMSMIDDVAKTVSQFMKEYKALDEEERPKILFVIDSLTMLNTPTDVEQFSRGDMKGDMGRKPRMLKAFVTNCVNMFGNYNVGMIATSHTYESQDQFNPGDKVSGGRGFVYAASIVININKKKLKEEEASSGKNKRVIGIKANCLVEKTRYAKPFEKAEVWIPWETGMDPYSGLFEAFKPEMGKKGNMSAWTTQDGEVIAHSIANWNANKDGCLDKLMEDIMKRPLTTYEEVQEAQIEDAEEEEQNEE